MFLEAQPRRTRLEEWVETPRFPEKNISSSDTFRFQTTTPMLREATERLEIKSAAPTCNQMSKTERRLLDRTPLARAKLEAALWPRLQREWHPPSHTSKFVQHHSDH